MKKYRLTAPDVDSLLWHFEHGIRNPARPSDNVCKAIDALSLTLRDLAPLRRNNEVKSIWVAVPRGTIDDFGSYEDMLENGEISSREEYEQYWEESYPDPLKWYELVIAEGFCKDGTKDFAVVRVGKNIIINASFQHVSGRDWCIDNENAAVELCSLLTTAAEQSMDRLRNGTYNQWVADELPYYLRTGVVQRSVVWEKDAEEKEEALKDVDKETVDAMRNLINSGMNNADKIGRLKHMTANDFFRACAIGYKACGYKGQDKPPADQYFMHADGRDEGLSGRGCGLNEGPGIDPDDPDAWDGWYFDRKRFGGHPWEVCSGGNSTHVDLYVQNDKNDLEYLLKTEKISADEYKERYEAAGYYFEVAGKYRAPEAIKFYIALSNAGLPVILDDAKEIMSRYDGSGYIGIVPHDCIPVYCESMFPEKYGRIIDYMHVYEEEMQMFGDDIEWLPEETAELRCRT